MRLSSIFCQIKSCRTQWWDTNTSCIDGQRVGALRVHGYVVCAETLEKWRGQLPTRNRGCLAQSMKLFLPGINCQQEGPSRWPVEQAKRSFSGVLSLRKSDAWCGYMYQPIVGAFPTFKRICHSPQVIAYALQTGGGRAGRGCGRWPVLFAMFTGFAGSSRGY